MGVRSLETMWRSRGDSGQRISMRSPRLGRPLGARSSHVHDRGPPRHPASRPRRRAAARDGALAIAPLVIGFAPFALVIGATVAASAHEGPGFAASWLVYGGSAQLALTRTLESGGAVLAVITGAADQHPPRRVQRLARRASGAASPVGSASVPRRWSWTRVGGRRAPRRDAPTCTCSARLLRCRRSRCSSRGAC